MFLRVLLHILGGLLLAVLALPVHAQAPDCTVDVALHDGPVLDVDYRCQSPAVLDFAPEDRRLSKHLSRLSTATNNAVRYTVDLKSYAMEVDSTSLAVLRGDGVVATLSSWLLEVNGFDHTPVIDIRVKGDNGLVFSAGLPKVGDGSGGTWRLAGVPVRLAGYTVVGGAFLQDISVPAPGTLRPGVVKEQGVLRVAILDGVDAAGRAELVDWVRRTAEAESNWWQGFTARQSMVALVPAATRRAVGFGRTMSGGGATVMIEVGSSVDRRRLFDDWVLVHELIHTGMPYIRNRGTWFMEGAATYIEPILRARAGWKTEPEVWQEWIDNMPQGASAFAIGMANASGRQNYWGGAMFMLMADIAIRRDTDGAKGLEDCVNGALWSGLDGTRRVTLQEYAAACDRAVGTKTMSGLVARHFDNREPVELEALWKQLGIDVDGGRIVLNDVAPLARWRKMIVLGPDRSKLKPVKLPWES